MRLWIFIKKIIFLLKEQLLTEMLVFLSWLYRSLSKIMCLNNKLCGQYFIRLFVNNVVKNISGRRTSF